MSQRLESLCRGIFCIDTDYAGSVALSEQILYPRASTLIRKKPPRRERVTSLNFFLENIVHFVIAEVTADLPLSRVRPLHPPC